MAKKTNKTSHVMDLLTNGASPETEASEAMNEASSPALEKKSDVQSHTVTPAKVTVVDEGSRNDRLSQEILGKLTEELEEETRQEQPAGGTEAVPEPEEEPVQESTEEEPAVPEQAAEDIIADGVEIEAPLPVAEKISLVAESELSKAPSAPAKEHPIIPESHFTSHTKDREYRFVNVMEQLLMRQDLDTVLTQHNVCTCPRCMSDVCSLALTGLPPKYVVTSKDSISPLLSYYENKYKISLLTEFMKACNKVRENPRHKKPL